MAAIYAACTAIGLLPGAMGYFFRPGPWYFHQLRKPSFNPPPWVFGPVWTTLYVTSGIALARVVIKRQESPIGSIAQRNCDKALQLFAAQWALNALWSPLFFGMENPQLALVDVILMVVALQQTRSEFLKIDSTAGNMLTPYLMWVSFATLLNASICYLNN